MKGACTMRIRLSEEVKRVIRQIVRRTRECQLKEADTLVLLQVLVEQDSTFLSDLEETSNIRAEEISKKIASAREEMEFREEKLSIPKDQTYLGGQCLREACVENIDSFNFSQDLADVFNYALMLIEEAKEDKILIDDIALSLIDNLPEDLKKLLNAVGVDIDKLNDIYLNSEEEEIDDKACNETCDQASDLKSEKNMIPKVLRGCVTVLNEQFAKGTSSEILGRDKELREIWKTMMKKTKRNIILKGEPGVGKTSVIYKLTCDIVNDECPEMFKNYTVLSLDVNSIIAGTTLRGQAEERFERLVKLIKSHDNIILFIDEIHMIVGAGSTSKDDNQNLSNALKPILATGDAIVIGATTNEEYERAFKAQGALKRRFREITVKEPKTTEVHNMLKKSIRQLEEFHGVKISKEMVEKIIFYSSCFNYNTRNPDRTKDLIDLSMVTAKMEGKTRVDQKSIMKNFEFNLKSFHEMTTEEVLCVAFHEVGHYIVHYFTDRCETSEIIAVTIVPTEQYRGANIFEPTDKPDIMDREELVNEIAVDLAGRVSEHIFVGSVYNSGASSDIEHATKLAYDMITEGGLSQKLYPHRIYIEDKKYHMQTDETMKAIDEEIGGLIEEGFQKALQILKEHEPLVKAIVEELCHKGMLSKGELEEIVRKNQKR